MKNRFYPEIYGKLIKLNKESSVVKLIGNKVEVGGTSI